jgi:hypothetical protein
MVAGQQALWPHAGQGLAMGEPVTLQKMLDRMSPEVRGHWLVGRRVDEALTQKQILVQ